MGIERTQVSGYGFVITTEEAEEFLQREGVYTDSPYEDLFNYLRSEYEGFEVISVGNEWSGPTGYLIASEGASQAEDAVAKMMNLKMSYGGSILSSNLRVLRSFMLRERSVDRNIGFYFGEHVF